MNVAPFKLSWAVAWQWLTGKLVFCTVLSLICVTAVVYFLGSLSSGRDARRRIACRNNIKTILTAINNYHDDFNAFPPAFTVNKQGKPLHSWRVLILPYLDCEDLYSEIRIGEPWDSPHNRTLMSQMPECYRCPGYQHHAKSKDESLANYVAVVSSDSAIRPGQSASIRDLAFGASNELIIIEVGNASVPWMAPLDIPPSNAIALLARRSSINHEVGVYIGMADGTVEGIHDPHNCIRVAEWIARNQETDAQLSTDR